MIQNSQYSEESSPIAQQDSEAQGSVIYDIQNGGNHNQINNNYDYQQSQTQYLQQVDTNQMTTDVEQQLDLQDNFKDSLCTTSEQEPLIENSQSSLNKNIARLFKQEKVIQDSNQSYDGNQPINLRNCVIQSSQTVNFEIVRNHKDQLLNLTADDDNGMAPLYPVQVRQKSRNTNSNLNNSPQNQRSEQIDNNYSGFNNMPSGTDTVINLEARVLKSNEIEDDEKTIDMCGLFTQEHHPLFGVEVEAGHTQKDGSGQQQDNYQSRSQLYEIAEVSEHQRSQQNENMPYAVPNQDGTFMQNNMIMGAHQQQQILMNANEMVNYPYSTHRYISFYPPNGYNTQQIIDEQQANNNGEQMHHQENNENNYFASFEGSGAGEVGQTGGSEYQQCSSPTWLKDSLNTTNKSSAVRKLQYPQMIGPAGTPHLPTNLSLMPLPTTMHLHIQPQIPSHQQIEDEDNNIFNAIDDAIDHFNESLKQTKPLDLHKLNLQKQQASSNQYQNESKSDSMKKSMPPNYISFQQKFQSAENSNPDSQQEAMQDSIHPWHQIERAQNKNIETQQSLQEDSSVVNQPQYTSNPANSTSVKTSPNLEKQKYHEQQYRNSQKEGYSMQGQHYLSIQNEGSNISHQLYTPSSQGGANKILMHKKLAIHKTSANPRQNKFSEQFQVRGGVAANQHQRNKGTGSKQVHHNLYPNTQPHSLNRRENNLINQRRSPYNKQHRRQKAVQGTTSSTDGNSLNGLLLNAQQQRQTNQTFNNDPNSVVDSDQQKLQIQILQRKLQLSKKKRRNSAQQYQRQVQKQNYEKLLIKNEMKDIRMQLKDKQSKVLHYENLYQKEKRERKKMERIVKSLAMAQALQMGSVQRSRHQEYRNNSALSCSSSPSPFNMTNTKLTQNIKSEALSSLNNMPSSKSNRNFYYTKQNNDSMTQLRNQNNRVRQQTYLQVPPSSRNFYLQPHSIDKLNLNQNQLKNKREQYNQQQIYNEAGQQQHQMEAQVTQTQQEVTETNNLQIDSIHSGSIDLLQIDNKSKERTGAGESPQNKQIRIGAVNKNKYPIDRIISDNNFNSNKHAPSYIPSGEHILAPQHRQASKNRVKNRNHPMQQILVGGNPESTNNQFVKKQPQDPYHLPAFQSITKDTSNFHQTIISGQNNLVENIPNINSLEVDQSQNNEAFASHSNYQLLSGDHATDLEKYKMWQISHDRVAPYQNYDSSQVLYGKNGGVYHNKSISPSSNSQNPHYTPIQSFQVGQQYLSSNDMRSPPVHHQQTSSFVGHPQIDSGMQIVQNSRANSNLDLQATQKAQKLQNHSQIIKDNKHLRSGVEQQLNLQKADLNNTLNHFQNENKGALNHRLSNNLSMQNYNSEQVRSEIKQQVLGKEPKYRHQRSPGGKQKNQFSSQIQIQTPVMDNSLSRQTDAKTEKIHKFSPTISNNGVFNLPHHNSSQSKIVGKTSLQHQNNNISNQSSQKSFQIKQMIKKICENGTNNEPPQASTTNKPPLNHPSDSDPNQTKSKKKPQGTVAQNVPRNDLKTIELCNNMIENSINDSSKTTKKVPDFKTNSERIEIFRHPKQFNCRSFKNSHQNSKLNSKNASRCPSPNLTVQNKNQSIIVFPKEGLEFHPKMQNVSVSNTLSAQQMVHNRNQQMGQPNRNRTYNQNDGQQQQWQIAMNLNDENQPHQQQKLSQSFFADSNQMSIQNSNSNRAIQSSFQKNNLLTSQNNKNTSHTQQMIDISRYEQISEKQRAKQRVKVIKMSQLSRDGRLLPTTGQQENDSEQEQITPIIPVIKHQRTRTSKIGY